MVDVFDLLEPSDPDARERWRLRQPPFTTFQQIDDAAAEALLREILALRRNALRDTGPSMDAAFDKARPKVRQLIEGIGGWAFYDIFMLSLGADDLYAKLPPRMRRLAIRTSLAWLPLLPGLQRDEIVHALESLDWGQTEEILAARPRQRRRQRPRDAAEAELDMLTWIRWQVGLGRREHQARDEVASAVGLSPAAVEKWRVSAEKSFGREIVQERLSAAEDIGRVEVRGTLAEGRRINGMLRKRLHAMDVPRTAKVWKNARKPN